MRKKKLLIKKKGAFAKDHRWCWVVRRPTFTVTDPKAATSPDVATVIGSVKRSETISYYRTGYGARMAQRRLGGKLNRDSVDNLGGWWDFRSLNPRKPSQRRQRQRERAAMEMIRAGLSDAAS